MVFCLATELIKTIYKSNTTTKSLKTMEMSTGKHQSMKMRLELCGIIK